MTAETLSPRFSALKRLSLPLSASDLADLKTIRNSPERLRALPSVVDNSSSDAALVHAVFEAGLVRVREVIEMAGYAELVDDQEYQQYHAARRAAAGRRRPE